MKYIITSIQLGARLNKNFYKNMLLFKEKHGVDKILVFVMKGRYISDDAIHPSVAELPDIELINHTYLIHSKVKVYDSKVLPQNIDPMRGLTNKLPSQFSYVLPATKVRYESIASIGTLPRFFTTTGALTMPLYKDDNKGTKARQQHEQGFVYFQDNGRGRFDVYNVKALKNGNFSYLQEEYKSGRYLKNKTIPCLVLGDMHWGDHNPNVLKVSKNQIRTLKPEYVILHDFFNGHSINHHEKKHLISQLRSLDNKRISLEQELRQCLGGLQELTREFPKTKFIVVESNHDVFITQYLQDKMHHKEPNNYLQAIKIIPRLINPQNIALKESLLTVTSTLPKNLIFLRENDSFKIRGIEVAQHGHKGANGSRGSKGQFKRLNVRTITGHTHSPCIFENGMIVGTSTWLELTYTMGGMSSWLNANGIIYNDGTSALLTIIPKKRTLRKKPKRM